MAVEFGPRITEGEWEGVDSRLRRVIEEYIARTGQQLVIRAGHEKRSSGKGYHPKGQAVDIWIKRPDGSLVPHGAGGTKSSADAARGFYEYEKVAKSLNQINSELFPGTPFRWGGYFSGGPNKYGALDTMHFDTAPIGMAGGSFEKGLYPGTMKAWQQAGLPIGRDALYAPENSQVPDYKPSAASQYMAYSPSADATTTMLGSATSPGSNLTSDATKQASPLMDMVKRSSSKAQHDPNDRRMLWEEDRFGRTRNPFQHNAGRQAAEAALATTPLPFANPSREPAAPPPSPFEMRGPSPMPPSPQEMRGPSPMSQPTGPMPPGPKPPAPMQTAAAPGDKGQMIEMLRTGAGGEISTKEDAMALLQESGDPLSAFALLLQDSAPPKPRSVSPDVGEGRLTSKAPSSESLTRTRKTDSPASPSSLLSAAPAVQGVDHQGNLIGPASSGPDWNTGMFGGSLALSQLSESGVDLSSLFAMRQKRKAAQAEAEIQAQLRKQEMAAGQQLFGGGSGSPTGGGGGAATGVTPTAGAAPSPEATGTATGAPALTSEGEIRASANRVGQALMAGGASLEDAQKGATSYYNAELEKLKLRQTTLDQDERRALDREKFETEEQRLTRQRSTEVDNNRAFARTMYQQYKDVDPATAQMYLDIATGPSDSVPSREQMEGMAGNLPQIDDSITRSKQAAGMLGAETTESASPVTPGQVYRTQNPTGIRAGQDKAAGVALESLQTDAIAAQKRMNPLLNRKRLLADDNTATGLIAQGYNTVLRPFEELGLLREGSSSQVTNDRELKALAQQTIVDIMQTVPGIVTDQDAERFSATIGATTETKDVLTNLTNFLIYAEQSKIEKNQFINNYLNSTDAPYDVNYPQAEQAYMEAMNKGNVQPLFYDNEMDPENILKGVDNGAIFDRGMYVNGNYIDGPSIRAAFPGEEGKTELQRMIMTGDWE